MAHKDDWTMREIAALFYENMQMELELDSKSDISNRARDTFGKIDEMLFEKLSFEKVSEIEMLILEMIEEECMGNFINGFVNGAEITKVILG